jgi:hypothetical protein
MPIRPDVALVSKRANALDFKGRTLLPGINTFEALCLAVTSQRMAVYYALPLETGRLSAGRKPCPV